MTTIRQIGRTLMALRDAYPNLFTESDDQWTARVTAYHSKLRRFDVDLIDEAGSRAVDKYPDRFPTAGQLVGLCISTLEEWKKKADEEAVEIQRKREDAETAQLVADRRRLVIPDIAADQERWISEGKTPFHRLARRWEVESKNQNFDPNRACPRAVGERRMAELMRTVGDSGFGSPIARAKPEPGSFG